MTKEQLADQINGNEYGNEHTKEQAALAKENGLVIVYGYSDDNIEFEGAVYDEVGMYEGGEIALTNRGYPEVDDDAQPITTGKNVIKAEWAPEGSLSWRITSDFPNAPFTIMEEGEPYCEGFVFSINDLNK